MDPWGTPCFNIPQSEKKILLELSDFISTFCLLFVKYDLKQSIVTPWMP
jgi:hypothetical protein